MIRFVAPDGWRSVAFVAAITAMPCAAVLAQAPPALRLTVFVVGGKDAPGTQSLLEAVRRAGMLPRLVERAICTPEALRTADVVLIDWPSEVALGDRLPLGELERWDRPTVFVGAAGDRFAQRWLLPTAAEMSAMPEEDRGPEMQQLVGPAGSKAPIWRQGHLFHFPSPAAADLTDGEREALVQVVQFASRFVTDRPIVRHAVANGQELPAAERERRRRIAEACARLRIAARDRRALLALPHQLDADASRPTAHLDRDPSRTIAQLLVDLVPGSCELETSRSNWRNWFIPREDRLVWDVLSQQWRVDRLAFWRGVASAACSGEQRADGGERQPEAVALAAKVVQRHGGRALTDLTTFSCWNGNVCYLWDRQRGYFRMENHAQPGARGTAWTVSVIDTAADEEVIWGGGPPPRPRVSARGAWRDLIERVFLPAMLLDPGVSLRRCAEHDVDGKQAIAVRLAGRGMDPIAEHLVLVDPATGNVAGVRRSTLGRLEQDWHPLGTTQCGLLLLPMEWVDELRRNRQFSIELAKWNPDLPAGIATATERLTEPRSR